MTKKELNRTYNFTAEIEKRNRAQTHVYGHVRILFRNIRLNGNLLFRDHVWVAESKKLKHLNIGDVIHFSCKLKHYLDSSDLRKNKLGIVHLRNIKVLKNNRRFKRDDRPYINNIWMKKLKKKLK